MMNNMFIVDKISGQLRSPFSYYDWSQPIQAAQPFSVTSVATIVSHDLDGFLRGKNDILIMSKSSLGKQPLIERIHFYEKDIEKGKPIRNVFSNTIYVSDDYNGDDRLWIELNVLEIDTDNEERRSAVNAFRSLAATAGAVFPVVLPYAMAASAGSKIVEKLFSAFEKNTEVVRIPVSFYPGRAKRGYAVLQEGTYVVFANPQPPEQFRLADNGLLESDSDISDLSYTVFDIYAEERVSPEFVLNQRIATLLTQLKSGNNHTTRSSFEFLTETLEAFSNFRKLERYIELSEKGELTEKEKELMEAIRGIDHIKQFLPTN